MYNDIIAVANGTSTIQKNVIETEQVKLLWDFTIQTDNGIQARRPDSVIINKIEKNFHIIDVAIPRDERVLAKRERK